MRTIGFFIMALLLWPVVPGHKLVFTQKGPSDKVKLSSSPFIYFDNAAEKNKTVIDTSQLKQSDWYANAIRNIEESEYEIKPAGKTTFASPNRQQNLRASYSADKFILQPRENNDWKLELQLRGVYSKSKKLYSPSTDAIATIEKNTIRFNHKNEFTVEYINSGEGVRQNFIIEKEPVSKPQTLNIKLQTTKGWFVNQVHPKEIHFAKVRNENFEKKLTYNDLKVWDENNTELEASFSVINNEVSINVNTKDAVYPITIDPISTGTSGTADWTAADANQPSARYGINVASAGDINNDGYSDVIVGAFNYDEGANTDEGRAFVYHGSATGLSLTPNSILDDADQAGALFGIVVNTAGDVNGDGYSDVIVGAHGYDDGPNADEGNAFIYYGSSTGLSASPVSVIDDMDQAGAWMGYINAASTAGDVNGDGYSDVVVGAFRYDDGPNTDEGRALVYYGSASGLSASPNVILNNINQSFAQFGFSVASAGDINGDGYSDVIVGASTYDGSVADEGAAFIYFGSASGLSAVPDDMVEDCNQAFASYGLIVNSAGDVNGDGYSDIIVGAYTYDDGANANEGRVFVYHGSPTGISTTADNIIDDANQANAGLGIRAASAGDINGDGYSDVIVGVYQYTEGANTQEGNAYIYCGSSSGLAASPNAIIDDADQANANLGSGATSAGDVNGDGYSDIIVGAWFYTDGGNSQEGRAYVYHGGPDGLAVSFIWATEGNLANALYGSSVACAGDVNADGYSDVIIGAMGFDGGQSQEGKAFVYYGSSSGLSLTPNWSQEGNQATAYYGVNVSGAGDVNGDGYGDVIVASTWYDNDQADEGRVFVYHGSATGLSPIATWTAESNQSISLFGVGVRGAGDVNGDGYGDVIVGAVLFDNGQTDEGRAYVYHGSSTGLSVTANWIVESDQASANMGFNISGAGDVNGDGYSDVIVGAPYYDNGQTDEGRVYVYHGSAAGLSTIPNWTGESDQAGAVYGINVSAAGDVNGDGYGDVIVGAYQYSNGQSAEGRSYVYHGSSTGLSPTANWTAESNQASAGFGFNVSSAGDVNGDGYSDVIVGASTYSNGENQEGRVYVYQGSSTGLSAAANWIAESNQAGAQMGTHSGATSAGDVNGDGYSDVIISAWYYTNFENSEGKVFVYYGNNTGGLCNNLRLYNSDLTTPIQQANMTDPNLFGAGLYAKSFLGNQKGKLVWQTVKNGVAFTGSPITNSTAYTAQQPTLISLGLTGTELKYQIAKQNPTKATYIRARVKYDLATAITGQVYGPWRYPEGFLRGRRDIGAVALPVKFISFTAVKENTTAKLKWITSSEEHGVKFEIQHSVDGNNFNVLSVLNGKNDTRNEYEWTHITPAKGNNFYRIKAIENDKTVFTPTRMISFDDVFVTSIYPNPAMSGEQITIKNENIIKGKIAFVSMVNTAGQIILQKEVMATVDGMIFLAIPTIPSGSYFLQVEAGQLHGNGKIIVVNKK